MQFFTSSQDLKKWVESFKSADEASLNIMNVIGKNEEQDIIQSCRSICDNKDESAAEVLFGILARHNITQTREGNMKDKLVKQAQAVMRQDALYSNMDMRICPKLPKQSAGHGLISTYNCRHYCLDSLVFDDDPNRVYCAEALWRSHVMDKFAREFKDKDGKWVGGYLNERFQIFRDDGGNNMELAHGERTRKPRPHQYSTERRLSEGRGEETTDLTASNKTQMIKLASVEAKDDSDIHQIFDDIIEMKQSGVNDEDIIYKVAEHYNKTIPNVAGIHKLAIKMLQSHNGIVYSHDNTKVIKTADFDMPDKTTLVSKRDVDIVVGGQKTVLKIETPVVVVSNNGGNPVLQIVDGPDAGKQFKLSNRMDLKDAFAMVEDMQNGTIQEAADESGLNEDATSVQMDDFPILENK